MKLGNLLDRAGLSKSNLKEALKLGIGAAAFPFAYGLIQQGMLKASPMFAQGTGVEMGFRALTGVVLGSVFTKMTKQSAVGDGMVASAIGSVGRDVAAGFISPSAAAVQAAVTATEQATGQSQVSGINPLGRLNGLGYTANPSMLFGVGTNAGKALNGATVAIEQNRRLNGLNGATVAIEQGRFAAAFT